jgi:transposase InsO family protein
MQLPKSSYYYKPKQKPSEKELKACIEDLCLQYPKYGYRRITRQLHREGTIVNHKRVTGIMRENG